MLSRIGKAFFRSKKCFPTSGNRFFSSGNAFPYREAIFLLWMGCPESGRISLGVPHFTPLLLAAGMAVVSDSFLRFPARKRCGEACYPDFPMRI
jgi:hypothetical protein